nr:site-specific integrase [Novosphingobium panipatense]
MSSTKLTDRKLKDLVPPASGQDEYRDTEVPGLRARIGSSGLIAFTLRKRVDGKVRNITLGRFGPNFGVAEARRKARTLLSDIEAGDGLKSLGSRSASGPATIAGLLPAYLKDKGERRSIGETERLLRKHVLPALGERMADRVTRKDVSDLVRDVSLNSASVARAVHAALSSFYGWALPDLPRLSSNPCVGARRPDVPEARDRVLSDEELAGLWRIAEEMSAPWGAGLKLLLLTGARRDEVFAADRAEFDLAAAEWIIPASRSKNGVPHLIPLSDDAAFVIFGIAPVEGSVKLLPGRNLERGASGYSRKMKDIRRALDESLDREQSERWTLHDIRRTVATRLQGLGVRFEVTEAVLNHVSGSRGGIAGVYQRHNWKSEKREALQLWVEELHRIVRQFED